MFIDVRDLVNKKKDSLDVDVSYNKEPIMAFEEKVEFCEDIKISGKLSRNGERLFFQGKLYCKVLLSCSKCLTKFPLELDLDVEEEFAREIHRDDIDIFEIKENVINIDEIVECNVISSLPIRFVCSERCKGLCPICGANLNVSSCKCEFDKEEEEEELIDPRFAKLQNLFKDK